MVYALFSCCIQERSRWPYRWPACYGTSFKSDYFCPGKMLPKRKSLCYQPMENILRLIDVLFWDWKLVLLYIVSILEGQAGKEVGGIAFC